MLVFATFLDDDVIDVFNHVDISNSGSFSFSVGGVTLICSSFLLGQGGNLRAKMVPQK